MRFPFLPAILLLVLSFSSAVANECRLDLEPGAAVQTRYPGYHGYLELWQPGSPPPATGYPVIFWYHGYSERLFPNTRIIRAATGGEIFLLVGMDYGTPRFYEDLDPLQLDNEVDRFHAVLQALEDCVPVDRGTVVMGGYSQGGYATSLIGERVIDELAGLVILGAGRSEGGRSLPSEADFEGLPIFMGIGEDDSVHRETAEASARVYALLGATVSLERWPDTTHIEGWRRYLQDVRHTAGLRNWLNDVLAK